MFQIDGILSPNAYLAIATASNSLVFLSSEKTKIVVKLTKKGSGAPAREPVVSEGERKAMMAHYFKKQEEMKKLAEDDDDNYEGANWADPKAMKRGLMGGGSGVAFRPGGRLL